MTHKSVTDVPTNITCNFWDGSNRSFLKVGKNHHFIDVWFNKEINVMNVILLEDMLVFSPSTIIIILFSTYINAKHVLFTLILYKSLSRG